MNKTNPAEQLAEVVVEGIQNAKGKDITLIDMQNFENSICDFFVVCSGTSHTQVESITEKIKYETKKSLQEKPLHTEGLDNSEWVLMDYSDVLIHIFHQEQRAFYNIEELWADAPIKEIPNIV